MSLLIPQPLTWQNVIYQARFDDVSAARDVSPCDVSSRGVSPLTVESRSQPTTLVIVCIRLGDHLERHTTDTHAAMAQTN